MSRTLKTVLALVAAQALAVGLWLAVERSRAAPDQAGPGAAAAAVRATRLNRPAPRLDLARPGGHRSRLSDQPGRPVVLHFWATWCPPCREELPGLLALAGGEAARVLAVSVDKEWSSVQRFFGGEPPAAISLADSEVASAAFGVQRLPVTYILDAGGRLRLRLDGPRRWSRDTLRAMLDEVRR